MSKIYNALKKYLGDICDSLQSSPFIPIKFRPFVLRLIGYEIGSGCYVRPGCTFLGANLSVGKDCVFAYGVYIDCSGRAEIGNSVFIAAHVKILTATHKIMSNIHRRDPQEVQLLTTKIAEGCWIGAGATILPGVSISEGCVIGSGAVVNADCHANGLYVGVPARRIKDLPLD